MKNINQHLLKFELSGELFVFMEMSLHVAFNRHEFFYCTAQSISIMPAGSDGWNFFTGPGRIN